MKQTLKTSIALAIVLIAGYNVYTSQQDVKMSSLTLANIEALMKQANVIMPTDIVGSLREMNEYMIAAIWKK